MATTHTPAHQAEGQPPPAPMTGKERREMMKKDRAEMDQREDDAAYERATGKMDDETKEKLLALGVDITRASPAKEQPLPDTEPGITTTTGAYRTPMDPTTAAVPADPDDERVKRMARGFPAVGSGKREGKSDTASPPPATQPPASRPSSRT